ncbi:uncharacterized protein TNCV_1371801 [Trichonephila clavipes]|nr:uncharacterized protein TNCV_1371801 [Trichonephila clavipes]
MGFERGRIIGLREEGFSYRAIEARELFHSDASSEAVDRRAPNNSKNWQWTMEGDDHDGRIRVRRYADERRILECIIERHGSQYPELWFGVQFRIMDDSICYELRVISVATVTFLKCNSPKSFPSFKASLELSFSRIMHASMLQKLIETSVQPNTCKFFLGLLIHRVCRLLSTCGILLVGVSLVKRILQLRKADFCCAYKQYGILFDK